MAVSPALREEFKTTLKVGAYATLYTGSIKASKKLVGTLAKSAKSATKGKFSLQKTFTNAEMKELLASQANDNVFLVNDNGIYMSKGKVVNGESVGVGKGSSSIVDSIESKILNSADSDAKLKASRSGRNSSKRAVFVETKSGEKATLTEYLGPGGGHHIKAKSEYKSHPSYDLNKALCLSNEEMARLKIDHLKVTREQRRQFIEMNKMGKELTIEESNRIAVEALMAGGASRQLARDIVASATWDLKLQGVRTATDRPWGRK